MSFSGADIEELRALAQRFERQSARLREISGSSTLALMTAHWTGAQIDGVRSEWNRFTRPRVLALAGGLAEVAAGLRRHAEQQERASSASSGSTGARSTPREAVAESPHDIRGLLEGVRDVHGSGAPLHIQQLVDADGTVRFVVNIGGTRDNWDGLGGWAENWDLYTSGNSPVVRAIRAELDRQLADHPDAEVMLVGYSQGGMVAQSLALSGDYNIAEVVTVGSPRLDDRDFGDVGVTRLEHSADPVVGITEGVDGSIFEDAGRSFRRLLDGNVIANPAVDFRAGNPLENLRAEDYLANSVHNVHTGDYDWVAEQFASSGDPRHVAANRRIESFLDGSVVRSEDLRI